MNNLKFNKVKNYQNMATLNIQMQNDLTLCQNMKNLKDLENKENSLLNQIAVQKTHLDSK